jgi:hypothetical protein
LQLNGYEEGDRKRTAVDFRSHFCLIQFHLSLARPQNFCLYKASFLRNNSRLLLRTIFAFTNGSPPFKSSFALFLRHFNFCSYFNSPKFAFADQFELDFGLHFARTADHQIHFLPSLHSDFHANSIRARSFIQFHRRFVSFILGSTIFDTVHGYFRLTKRALFTLILFTLLDFNVSAHFRPRVALPPSYVGLVSDIFQSVRRFQSNRNGFQSPITFKLIFFSPFNGVKRERERERV